MERERANSKYSNDPRVEWIPDGHAICLVRQIDLDGHMPPARSGMLLSTWDGKIYSDEWIEFAEGDTGYWTITLRTTSPKRKRLDRSDFLTLDDALAAILGEPYSTPLRCR